jgi:translin
MSGFDGELERIVETIQTNFRAKHAARESAIIASRDIIRNSANAIRAVHRGDYATAEPLLEKARELTLHAAGALEAHKDIYHAGFLHDAQKEFAEAHLTYAMIAGKPLPSPEEIGVPYASYLNGLAEAASELRRHILDRLRANEVERCEDLLQQMDEVYSLLITIDFPDAMTGGLRRTTDALRAVLERTRGDLTLSLRQRRLEERLSEFEGTLKHTE